MQNLNIALIQSELVWENISANLERFNQKIESLTQKPDLIVLPEMFSTGFTMNCQQYSEPINGRAVQWMKDTAKEKNVVITGSLLISEKGGFFNRLIWMMPDGSYSYYDKKHLFRFGNEHIHYTPGNILKTFDCKGWKVRGLICYDLRFPVWTRNQHNDGSYDYDFLIFVANWPEKRKHHWRSLLVARAIENQAYVAGVNRCGYDGNGVSHSGNSMLVSPAGEILYEAPEGIEDITLQNLSMKNLADFRAHFNVGQDWDRFSLHTS